MSPQRATSSCYQGYPPRPAAYCTAAYRSPPRPTAARRGLPRPSAAYRVRSSVISSAPFTQRVHQKVDSLRGTDLLVTELGCTS
eukprot:3564953-Prymnesium_polylepis.1